MIDLFLKFTDEAEALAALFNAVEVPATEAVVVPQVFLYEFTDVFGKTHQFTSDVELSDADAVSMVREQFDAPELLGEVIDVRLVKVIGGEISPAKPASIKYQPRYAMSIDIIGTIYKPTGVMLDSDTPEMAAVDGWHVNTRGEAPEELLKYSIVPTQPVRVWS